MDHQDGRDPFDAETYSSPMTIKSMIELRAFCAAFFEDNIRKGTKTIDPDLLARFIALITSSKPFFARARAVIPELQFFSQPTGLSCVNPNVQRVLQLTEDLRHMPDTGNGKLIEEAAWSKLAKDGQEKRTDKAERLANEPDKRMDRPNSPLYPRNPAQSQFRNGDGPKEHAERSGNQHSPSCLGASAATDDTERSGKGFPPPLTFKPLRTSETDTGIRTNSEAIATFVPRNQLGRPAQLVWSPTSGTRERRPEELYQNSASHPASASITSRSNPANTPSEARPYLSFSNPQIGMPNMQGHDPDSSRNSMFVEIQPYQSALSPVPGGQPFALPGRDATFRHRILSNTTDDDIDLFARSEPKLKIASPNQEISSMMYETRFGNKQNWKPVPSNRGKGPGYPVNQVNGIMGLDSTPASPSITEFGDLHISGQRSQEGPSSPSLPSSPGHVLRDGLQNPPLQPQPEQDQFGRTLSPSTQQQLGEHIFDGPLLTPPFQHQLDQISYREATTPYAQSQRRSFVPSPEIWGPAPTSASSTYQPPPPPPSFPYPGSIFNENLTVPPPGSMSPVDYWDMLRHRQIDIQKRLAYARLPMTDELRDFIARLGETRIATIASRLPFRGNKSAKTWLQILQNEMVGIWEQRPGDQAQTPVVMDRKADYEKAVQREIQAVMQEISSRGAGQM